MVFILVCSCSDNLKELWLWRTPIFRSPARPNQISDSFVSRLISNLIHFLPKLRRLFQQQIITKLVESSWRIKDSKREQGLAPEKILNLKSWNQRGEPFWERDEFEASRQESKLKKFWRKTSLQTFSFATSTDSTL